MDSIDTKHKKEPGHPLEHQPGAPVAGVAVLLGMVAPHFIWSGPVAALVSMGVGIAGSLAVGALIKPPRSKLDQSGGGERGTSFQSVRNQARLYQPVEEIFGKRRVYPSLAAVPYTEQVGSDTWVRMLLKIGIGEYNISEVKVGETAITSYTGYEFQTGYIDDADVQEIYPNDVTVEGTLPVEVTYASGGLIKTTAADTTEISVDVGCPDGLFQIFDSGNLRGAAVIYTVRYRVNSPQGSWVNFSGSPITQYIKTQGIVSWNHRVTGLSADTYDVEVVKTTVDHPPPGSGVELYQDNFYWMALRSINSGSDAVLDTDTWLMAVRLKITGNFNGNVDTINCIAERKLSAWSGSAWGAVAVTRSPAWAFAYVLRQYVDDADIDGDALLAWDTNCTSNGFKYDLLINSATTAKELLEDIAAIGRASRAIIDGRHTIIEDVAQGSNQGHFSPRNSWGFKGQRQFLDFPHAIKCRYVDETNGYQVEEVTVYDDGYDSGSATDFETMEFVGVVDYDHVWKLVRYHMAVARLRPEVFEINVDAENLRNTRGDRVGLTHDVMLTGLGQARIKSIDGSDVTMDDTLTMEGGKTYGAIVRKADGTFLSTTITLDAGEQSTVELGSVTGIAAADLMFFGETDAITQDCIIKGIEYGSDLSAKLTLTNYDAAIYTADSGEIPPFTPVITQPPVENRVPPTVTIDSITIGYWPVTINDLSEKNLHATINFYLGVSTEIEPEYFETQFRSYDDVDGVDIYSPWEQVPNVPLEARQVHVPVQDGSFYDFRIRAVSRYGITGAWATESDYQVVYAGLTPNDITGLDLVQTGSVWSGLDCAIIWTAPTDLWRVDKVKASVYETSPLTLLRTAYLDPQQFTATYSFAMNSEDNAGSPIGDLTFRVSAISKNGDEGGYDEHVVTHVAPSSISSLTGTAWAGAVEFTWDANTDPAFSHFEYRVKVGAALNGESWLRVQNPYYMRTLTSAEKDAYGAGATIYIEVKAVNKFGQESGVSSTNQAASSLNVTPTDIQDFAVSASKLFNKIPVVEGLTITENSPSAEYVAWSAHSIYYNGVKHNINAGNSDLKYIYWKDLEGADPATTDLLANNQHPADNQAVNWLPEEDFIIIVNNLADVGGKALAAWNSIANQVIGSAYIKTAGIQTAHIQDLAVVDAKINDLAAQKITIPGSTGGATLLWNEAGGNLCTDPNFTKTEATDDDNYWEFDGTYTEWIVAGGYNGSSCARMHYNPSSQDLRVTNPLGFLYVPIKFYDSVYFRFWAKDDGTFDGDFKIKIRLHDDNKDILSTGEVTIATSGSWAEYSGSIKIELQTDADDVAFVQVGFSVGGGTAGYVDINDAYIGMSQNLDGIDGSAGTLEITSSGSIEISAADAILIKAGGSMTLEAGGGITLEDASSITLAPGGDITLNAESGDQAQIDFNGDARTFTFSVDFDTDYLNINPDSDGVGSISIGTATKAFDNFHVNADSIIDLYMASGKGIYMSTNGLWLRHSSQIDIEGPVFISERGAAAADKSGHGQLWVKSTNPTELWFTDDAGTPTKIA